MQRLAPWLLTAYTFLLCYILSLLPVHQNTLGDYAIEVLPRAVCGICLLLVTLMYSSNNDADRYVSREWAFLHVFIFVSVCMLYALFGQQRCGLNGLIGDAYFSTAMITKYKYFSSLTDFNYLGLSTSYPALYHYIVGKSAALFSVESFAAVKYGYYLVYAVLSIPLYLLIKKCCKQTVAVAWIIFIFLQYPFDNIFKPYEFISSAFFLVWWIYFVERPSLSRNVHILIGGLIGGLIFATYYYWFFAGAIYILVFWGHEMVTRGPKPFFTNRKKHFLLLITAAVTSSFYWLPLLKDFLAFGVVSLQNRWLSEEMVHFSFISNKSIFSGFISLTGVIFTFIFFRDSLMKILFKLLLSCLILYSVGFVLLFAQIPLVVNKLHYLMDAICAMAFFHGLFNLVGWQQEIKERLILACYIVLLLLGCNTFMELKAHPFYASTRNFQIKFFQDDSQALHQYKNKVMLTDRQHINALIPVHYFININAHFSHPASRFRERIAFLEQLQAIKNPDVLAWMLAYNKFNKVDLIFFENTPELTIFDDNFPYGHSMKKIVLTPDLFTSSYLKYYGNIPGENGNIYALEPPPYALRKSFSPLEERIASQFAQKL
ncbi:MAG: arabinofuranosyltransferase [Chitinophagales bacterium]|nr:arabinofuranosyltransferase [Chitinophagales bacterium]